MRFWEKVKLLFQMLLSFGEIEKVDEQEVERLKQTDVLEAILLELEKDLPFLRKILIDERDRYIAEKIRTAPGNKIVAVVGAGHVPGIKKYLTQNTDLAELETIPPKKNTLRYITWAIPVVVCALFFFGFFMGGADRGTRMLTWWILVNGALAGIGALVALAHPFTVVSSVVAAPLTSLNPMIAAGWVSGLVEAFSRKPRVKDFESLADDILSFKGFWKNKITRILLVVVFTNLGSSAGTLIALPIMIRVLG
jgi:pheromone shutdown-related protein TraB